MRARLPGEYTLREAAAACDVSIDVIKRRLRAGAFARARQLDDGPRTWLVPAGDLLAAGLIPRDPVRVAPLTHNHAGVSTSLGEADALRIRVASAEAVCRVQAEQLQRLQEALMEAVRGLARWRSDDSERMHPLPADQQSSRDSTAARLDR